LLRLPGQRAAIAKLTLTFAPEARRGVLLLAGCAALAWLGARRGHLRVPGASIAAAAADQQVRVLEQPPREIGGGRGDQFRSLSPRSGTKRTGIRCRFSMPCSVFV
jgi:hypothetical protein